MDKGHKRSHSQSDGRHVQQGQQTVGSPNSGLVSSIVPADVLLGRGKGIQQHPGNRKMLLKIKELSPEYHSSVWGDKRAIVDLIIQWVHAQNGKFLKKFDDYHWLEVDRRTVHHKIGQAFRRSGPNTNPRKYAHDVKVKPQLPLQDAKQDTSTVASEFGHSSHSDPKESFPVMREQGSVSQSYVELKYPPSREESVTLCRPITGLPQDVATFTDSFVSSDSHSCPSITRNALGAKHLVAASSSLRAAFNEEDFLDYSLLEDSPISFEQQDDEILLTNEQILRGILDL